MFVREKVRRGKNGRRYSYYYLVKSFRDGEKIRQKVVKYLGRKKRFGGVWEVEQAGEGIEGVVE